MLPECTDVEFNTLEQYVTAPCFTALSAQRLDMDAYLTEGQRGNDPLWTVKHATANRLCFGSIPESVATGLACRPYVVANWPASLSEAYFAPSVAALQANLYQIFAPPTPPPACNIKPPCTASATCCGGYACGGISMRGDAEFSAASAGYVVYLGVPHRMQCLDCSEAKIVWNAQTSVFEPGVTSAYSWKDDAMDACHTYIPPSSPPPTPPPPPPSPPVEGDGSVLFNDPNAICGGGCVGAIVIATFTVGFGILYYFMERVKKKPPERESEASVILVAADVELKGV